MRQVLGRREAIHDKVLEDLVANRFGISVPITGRPKATKAATIYQPEEVLQVAIKPEKLRRWRWKRKESSNEGHIQRQATEVPEPSDKPT